MKALQGIDAEFGSRDERSHLYGAGRPRFPSGRLRGTRNCPHQSLCRSTRPRSATAMEMLSESSSSAGFVFVPPSPKLLEPSVLDSSCLNGLHLGLAVLDVELTQHCIANHHCVEGNPLMPSSHAGQLGMNLALVGYGSLRQLQAQEAGQQAVGTLANGRNWRPHRGRRNRHRALVTIHACRPA